MSDQDETVWQNSRYVENPPGELYETTWRDARETLEKAGPKSGFILVTAEDVGEHYKTKIHVSSGTDKVTPKVMVQLFEMWAEGNL